LFAHKTGELRYRARHVSYKTVPCTDFHGETKYCRYGAACTFIHLPDVGLAVGVGADAIV
jgi:hypothetical protein